MTSDLLLEFVREGVVDDDIVVLQKVRIKFGGVETSTPPLTGSWSLGAVGSPLQERVMRASGTAQITGQTLVGVAPSAIT